MEKENNAKDGSDFVGERLVLQYQRKTSITHRKENQEQYFPRLVDGFPMRDVQTRAGVAALPSGTSAALAAPRPARGPRSPLPREEHATGPYARPDTKLGIINSRADLPAMTRVIKVNGTRISSASICTGGSALTRSSRAETN